MHIPTHSSHKEKAQVATKQASSSTAPQKALTTRPTWRSAFQRVLPVYIATHMAFLLLTYLATLFDFIPKNFSLSSLPLSTLVQSWERWDSYHFVEIATKGYDVAYRTAFFPLFPLLEAGLGVLLHDPFVAGLLISNMAGLAMLVVLYQLMAEDFDGGLGIPAGLGAFALYCYIRFHDALAFSHAQQSSWLRDIHGPWHGMLDSLLLILHRNVLTFDSIHNVIDLSAGLFMLILVVLCFVGPWRFPREMWAYALYAAISYLFILLFPVAGGFPLSALSRYVLEVFPAFLVLATMGKARHFHLYYLTLAATLLVFLLLQFLTGYWI